MSFGTIVVADLAIHWKMGDSKGDDAQVTVQDTVDGESETLTVRSEDLAWALMLLVSFDGEFPDGVEGISLAWEWAEKAQPKNPKLRFIP
jgi:hypothetical protein